MRYPLFARRSVLFPTSLGWLFLLAITVSPIAWWSLRGEAFLSRTDRLPADVLIIEAWLLADGAEAAATELKSGQSPYKYVVATGGLTGERWTRQRWNSVEEVERELRRRGISREMIIGAQAADVESHRTYESALAARAAIEARGLHPRAVNVFTRGAHARRSRLIFAKVFGPDTKVGVISWNPPGYEAGYWWNSSERAEDLMKESFGYWFDPLIAFGRHPRKDRWRG